MRTYFRVIAYLGQFKGKMAFYTMLVIFQVAFSLVNFSILIPILDILFEKEAFPASETPLPPFELNVQYVQDSLYLIIGRFVNANGRFNALLLLCGVLMGSVFLNNFFRYFAALNISFIRYRVIERLRTHLFNKLMGQSLGFFVRRKKGDITSRLSNDITSVENLLNTVSELILKDPILIIGYIAILLTISVKLSIAVLLFVPATSILISVLIQRLRKRAQEHQVSMGVMQSMAEESLQGIQIIQAFGIERYMSRRFLREAKRYTHINLSILRKAELTSPLSEFLSFCVICTMIITSGYLILKDESTLRSSEFITFVVIFSQLISPFKRVSSAITNAQKGIASAQRVFEYIDFPSAIQNRPNALPLERFDHEIKFENVSFRYEKEDVLKGIRLDIRKHQLTALVGPSGGGKSTIASLLLRFYEASEGAITIDGKPIEDYTIESLRGHMGMVSQEVILFNDTIKQNILLGNPHARAEEVESAARIANAHEFIMQTPMGYDTLVGDRGLKLSGGQKQRIHLARAILSNPSLLVLDEATASLDSEAEAVVQAALDKAMKSRTALVIAHRLSTVRHADCIYVIKNGQLVEKGKHKELLKKEGLYAELVKKQSLV